MKSSWLNWPLAAILLVGTAIVIADGFTRPLVLEEDWENSEAMTYEPYHAAFVFGLAMLPLMMAYRKSAGISKKESVLLWFVMCTVAYSKDFAYIVPGFTRFPPKWPQDFGKNAKAGNDLAIRERGDLCEPRRSFGPGQNTCAPRLCHRCVLDVLVGDFSRRFVVAGYQKDLHVFRARRAFLQY